MLRLIRFLVIIGAISFFSGQSILVYAEENKVGDVLMVKGTEATAVGPHSSAELIGRIFIYLALLAAIGVAVVYFFKQGRFVRGMRNNGNRLKICETHMLGNKQFLVVVAYGKEQILLGVGPGMINKLCFLDTPEEGVLVGKDGKKPLK